MDRQFQEEAIEGLNSSPLEAKALAEIVKEVYFPLLEEKSIYCTANLAIEGNESPQGKAFKKKNDGEKEDNNSSLQESVKKVEKKRERTNVYTNPLTNPQRNPNVDPRRREPLTDIEINAIKEAHTRYPEFGAWNLSLLLSNELAVHVSTMSILRVLHSERYKSSKHDEKVKFYEKPGGKELSEAIHEKFKALKEFLGKDPPASMEERKQQKEVWDRELAELAEQFGKFTELKKPLGLRMVRNITSTSLRSSLRGGYREEMSTMNSKKCSSMSFVCGE